MINRFKYFIINVFEINYIFFIFYNDCLIFSTSILYKLWLNNKIFNSLFSDKILFNSFSLFFSFNFF